MPNARHNPFSNAAERAAKKTDEELAGELANLKAVNWSDIRKMLPDPADQQKIGELIAIVKEATDHNVRVAKLINNINRLGGVVVSVLRKLP